MIEFCDKCGGSLLKLKSSWRVEDNMDTIPVWKFKVEMIKNELENYLLIKIFKNELSNVLTTKMEMVTKWKQENIY